MEKAKTILFKTTLILTIAFALLAITSCIVSIKEGFDFLKYVDDDFAQTLKPLYLEQTIEGFVKIFVSVALIVGAMFLFLKNMKLMKKAAILAIFHLVNFATPLFREIFVNSFSLERGYGSYSANGYLPNLLTATFSFLFVFVTIAALVVALCQMSKKEKTAKQNDSVNPVD